MRREIPGWFSAEVDWLVNCSESEHGRRAVPLEPSLGGNPDTMDDLRCRAASRARRVTVALGSIPTDAARLLLAAHEYACPHRPQDVARAAKIASERSADLLVAAASFRRAWVALGAVQGPRGVSA